MAKSSNGALAASLTYATRYGWKVLPIRRGTKRPCGQYGLWHASSLPDVIRDWFARWPRAGVAIACAPSGLTVTDTDRRNGGDPRALELAGDLPSTFTVATHDGIHRYWQHPGVKVRPILDPERFPGHDVKSKGFVCAPPTPHPAGGTYRLIDATAPAPMPEWLRDLVVAPEPKRQPVRVKVQTTRAYVEAAVKREAHTVATTPEGGGPLGGRNKQLNASTFALARFIVNDDDLDVATIVNVMTDAARAAGLDDPEIGSTISSALRARGIEQ